MVAGAGAGIAAPTLAEAEWNAISSGAPPIAEGEWKPAFFNDAQNESLISMSERIVPGSTAAQVNRFLDVAVAAVTQENQRKFVDAVNAIEGESLRQFQKSFAHLAPDQQDAVLQTASTAAPADAELRVTPPSLRDHFEFLKNWVSSAYYSSEIGMKELGWNGENFFESLPGCTHGEGHS
jgi:hypothetical protein